MISSKEAKILWYWYINFKSRLRLTILFIVMSNHGSLIFVGKPLKKLNLLLVLFDLLN